MNLTVGLTYDLREEYRLRGLTAEETAEFDGIETIEALEGALASLECRTDRIGSIHRLTERLVAGDRWDLVFNIAEGLRGFGREAQVPALLDAYEIPYTFSDPLTLAVALHKAMAKRVVRDLGVPTPDFTTVNTAGEAPAVALPFPLFVKPVAGGTSQGIDAASKVLTRESLTRRCAELAARFQQPVLVERYLPGREVTAGVIGTGANARVLGVMEVLLQPAADQDVYSYTNKSQYHGRVEYALASGALSVEAADVALRVWRGLGCRDAGRVDLRCDERGRVHFLEVNPLAGLHPVDSDLAVLCGLIGTSYRELIALILSSAGERLSNAGSRLRAAATVADGV
jgi:D-alanine-D-alanine ligase